MGAQLQIWLWWVLGLVEHEKRCRQSRQISAEVADVPWEGVMARIRNGWVMSRQVLIVLPTLKERMPSGLGRAFGAAEHEDFLLVILQPWESC